MTEGTFTTSALFFIMCLQSIFCHARNMVEDNFSLCISIQLGSMYAGVVRLVRENQLFLE